MASGLDVRIAEGLLGLPVESQITGSAVAFVADTWTSIKEVTALEFWNSLLELKITVTGGTPTTPTYRLSAKEQGGSYQVIFPFSGSQTLVSGQEDIFLEPIRIPKGGSFKVEVNCTVTGSASATLTYLDRVEHKKI